MKQPIKYQKGISLVQLLVTITLASTVITAATTEWVSSQYRALKLQNKTIIRDEAWHILEIILKDIRYCGVQLPANLSTLEPDIFPILPTSDNNTLILRKKLTDNYSMLTTEFDTSTRVLQILNTPLFENSRYLSGYSGTVGADGGFFGEIEAVSGNNITLKSSFKHSGIPEFPIGTSVQPITEIIYSYNQNKKSLTRTQDGIEAELFAPARIFFRYLSMNNSEIVLPLNVAKIKTEVATVEVQVTLEKKYIEDQSAIGSVSVRSLLRRG
jgi:type II secretory pathway pseudopilin PulG